MSGQARAPDNRIRIAREDDAAFLRQMIYEAAHWRAEEERPLIVDGLADDSTGRYVVGWGRPGDVGLIAEDHAGSPIGAAWFRLFRENDAGYGFIAESIPELSIAVQRGWRGRGIGKALLSRLIEHARVHRFAALSLSVEPGNTPAIRLYERVGFVPVVSDEGSWIMRLDLSGSN